MTARTINGLYAITPDSAEPDFLLSAVRQSLQGGASVIQYRNKVANAPHLQIAQALARLCNASGVPFIVNDDIELALATGADGVHLGRDDGDIVSARRQMGAEAMIGVSCYGDIELALAAQETGASYVAFGSMFPSSTKPEAPHAPLSLLTEAKAQLRVPIVAIGGITLQNAPLAIAAGAKAVAVISAVFDAPDVKQAAHDFSRLFIEEPRP